MADLPNHIYYFNLISTIVLTVFGIIGNSLVIFILNKKKLRKVPIFRYLTLSTISDTINVILMWPSIFDFLINNQLFNCKIFRFFAYLPYQFSAWMICVSSVDRFLSVKYPYRFKIRNKLRFQVSIVSVVFIGLISVDLPYAFYNKINTSNNISLCSYDDESVKIGFYLDILNGLTTLVVPFIVMVISTILITHQLIKLKKGLDKNRKEFDREMKFAKVALSMDLWFVLCTLPYFLLTIISDATNDTSYRRNTIHGFAFLTNCFSSLNFMVFILCNQLFRNYFIKIFNCISKYY